MGGDEPYPRRPRSLRPPTEEDVGEPEARYLVERKVLSLEKEIEELKKRAFEGRS